MYVRESVVCVCVCGGGVIRMGRCLAKRIGSMFGDNYTAAAIIPYMDTPILYNVIYLSTVFGTVW